MNGLKMAAIYGLRPHQLGFCGPKEKETNQVLLDYLKGRESLAPQVRKILEQFVSAYGYYQLIANSNGIIDPFDSAVVEAYWLGNSLLDKVKVSDLRQTIVKDFTKPGFLPLEIAEKKAKEIPAGAVPHHSFHVLLLGPVSGRVVIKDKLLDLCRIGWGQVIVQKMRIIVSSQPLKTPTLELGKAEERKLIWNREVLPKIEEGDWVSFHWDLACQVLTAEQVANLLKYTQKTLSLI